MKRQMKLAIAVAASLLTVGSTMTAFAATGWSEENGTWYYYDADENRVSGEWVKTGENRYWMDSENDGAMAVDQLIEYGSDYYYVGSDGRMVKNTWVKIANEEIDSVEDPAEYHFYYMMDSGKAYKASGSSVKFATIEGKKYAFDQDGKMLYGWVSKTAGRMTDADSWATSDSQMYYLGDWQDGEVKTGWQKIMVNEAKEGGDTDYWFYFLSDGRRFFNDTDDTYKTKKINGLKYGFDQRGVMVSMWNVASTSSASTSDAENWTYFGDPVSGAGVTRGWFKTTPPTEDTTFTDGVGDSGSFDAEAAGAESNWYYTNGEGNLYAGVIKSINGKYYGFAPNGKMLSGLVLISVDSSGKITEIYDEEVEEDKLEAILDSNYRGIYDTNASLYYFGGADDGAMRTGNVKLTFGGTQYDFLFSKSGGPGNAGRGAAGIENNKYIYKAGIRVKASKDDKYTFVAATDTINSRKAEVAVYNTLDNRENSIEFPETNKDGETVKYVTGFFNDVYLVDSNGAVIKNKTALKDANDWYLYVKNYKVKLYTDNKVLPDSLKDWEELRNYDRPQ